MLVWSCTECVWHSYTKLNGNTKCIHLRAAVSHYYYRPSNSKNVHLMECGYRHRRCFLNFKTPIPVIALVISRHFNPVHSTASRYAVEIAILSTQVGFAKRSLTPLEKSSSVSYVHLLSIAMKAESKTITSMSLHYRGYWTR